MIKHEQKKLEIYSYIKQITKIKFQDNKKIIENIVTILSKAELAVSK